MDRREFFQFTWKQSMKAAFEFIKSSGNPVYETLDAISEDEWMDISLQLSTTLSPVIVHTGSQLVAVYHHKEPNAEQSELFCLEAKCPHCSNQIYWVAQTSRYLCMNCLRQYHIDGTPFEDGQAAMQPWPVIRRNENVLIKKKRE